MNETGSLLMLQSQEILSIHKIEFWCELTMTVLIWEILDLCFCSKIYIEV